MKKLVYLLIAVSLMLALVPTGASADEITVDLLAGQTEDIGYVRVWNDADTLYVQFVYEGPDCGFLEVHLQVDESAFSPDIFTKKGNPIPGQFEKSYKPGGCFTDHTFEYDLAVEGFAPGDSLLIATHAALGREDAMTIVSGDGNTVVTQRRSGNAVGFSPLNQPAVLAWEPGPNYPNDGPDDSAWEAWSLWDRRLSINLVPTGADWIWEAYRVLDPVYGTVLTLQRTFDIGYPIDGNLLIACDNGYEVFLNGTSLGSDNVYDDWRLSNLKQAYVDVSGWDTVGSYNLLDYLLDGTNVLTIDAANEYFNPDDQGNPYLGTESSNPAACIFEADIDYYADGETAWACGEDNCDDFPGKNWATYFTYTVQEHKIVIAGWHTDRGGNYSLNSADSAQARNDLQAKYSDLDVRALGELTAANLADVDVVVLSSVRGNSAAITPLSGDEQTALYNFVLGGGCAILFPDNSTFAGGNSDPANESLIDPFGLDIMGTLGGVYNANVVGSSPVIPSGATSYSGNYAGWFNNTGTATVLATLDANAEPSLVEFTPDYFGTGSGRVVVFSDANVFFGGGAGRYSYNTELFLSSVDACFQP